MQRLLVKVLWIVMVAYIGFILLTHRALFFSRFDEVYWKDRYEHSQWKLPLSNRTIGDDGLYLYEGWRIIQGGDPTTLNAEVPPLGKYLIGISLATIQNGYWFGLLTTIGAVVFFYLLSRTLLHNTLLSFGLSLVFLVDPLVTNQLNLTMLDSL